VCTLGAAGGVEPEITVLRRRLCLAALATVCVALLAPSQAGARGEGPLWSTINACAPTAVGARASVPGGKGGERFVRFTLQWLSPQDGWMPVTGRSTSPWLSIGAGHGAGQAGWTFDMVPPPPGAHFTLRAVADTPRGSIVTSGGLAGVDEGQPPGTSLATCSTG
jgi:hypothetical protein